jgi:DNA-binding NtrC family response regulator
VLIVDDELLIRWALSEVLSSEGHRVLQADTAAAALRAITTATRPFDVVLLDLRLPDSDGLGRLGAVRARSPRSAVVMMTAHGTPDTLAGARALGAYDVMAKPFDVHQIEPVVMKAHQARAH